MGRSWSPWERSLAVNRRILVSVFHSDFLPLRAPKCCHLRAGEDARSVRNFYSSVRRTPPGQHFFHAFSDPICTIESLEDYAQTITRGSAGIVRSRPIPGSPPPVFTHVPMFSSACLQTKPAACVKPHHANRTNLYQRNTIRHPSRHACLLCNNAKRKHLHQADPRAASADSPK